MFFLRGDNHVQNDGFIPIDGGEARVWLGSAVRPVPDSQERRNLELNDNITGIPRKPKGAGQVDRGNVEVEVIHVGHRILGILSNRSRSDLKEFLEKISTRGRLVNVWAWCGVHEVQIDLCGRDEE